MIDAKMGLELPTKDYIGYALKACVIASTGISVPSSCGPARM